MLCPDAGALYSSVDYASFTEFSARKAECVGTQDAQKMDPEKNKTDSLIATRAAKNSTSRRPTTFRELK